jgi:hypothetical protein
MPCINFLQKLQNQKEKMDRRKFPRINTNTFISFVKYNKNGQIENQKTGTAIDVSQGGILLETTEKIDTKSISLITTSSDNKLIEIKATVLYTRQVDGEKFQNGISLQGNPDENLRFVTGLVHAYLLRKKSQNRNIFL